MRGWRGALTENDIFTPDEMAHDAFHQEFIVPSGFPSFAGIVVARRPGLMVSASIYRRSGQGPFERSEIEFINALTDQLRPAVAIAMRIGLSAMVRTADALASSGQAIALIAQDGRVAYTTPAFDRLIGNGIQIKNGRLGCSQADADRCPSAAIGQAIDLDGFTTEPKAAIVVPRRCGLRPLIAEMMRWSAMPATSCVPHRRSSR